MKGIVLAGGTGSRLYPLTKVTNKHLLPVGGMPMIYYPIRKLTEAGIEEILIVTGTEHMGDVVNLLGSGREFSCRFTYKVQDEAGGIAQALGLARNFCGDESMAVLLGDNLFEMSLAEPIHSWDGTGARILVKEVEDPTRFGVATLDGDRVVKIEEKPARPESDWAVTGIYLYDASVFDRISTLKPSDRGELEITDVNNDYLREGQLHCSRMEGWWTDAGTHDSYRRANGLVLERPPFPGEME
ncbi:MAG: sugar phosphate nucleotidyltransferase [Bacteroidota bacterium]